jgi:hypothetical protein
VSEPLSLRPSPKASGCWLGSLGGSEGECKGQQGLRLVISHPNLCLPVVVEQFLGTLHQPLERLRSSLAASGQIDAVLICGPQLTVAPDIEVVAVHDYLTLRYVNCSAALAEAGREGEGLANPSLTIRERHGLRR